MLRQRILQSLIGRLKN
ncbi:unnamed protein product [Callosobruchus maculatus]|uniref:Uncharacterized protein n=1 Tax=Callosobruchus maculatus TaxID=64391 RepID=A0A653CGU4_CALMS|nr:unnamed protein product [Callosobruchus maculatus]